MTLKVASKFDGAYIDFLGFIPTMTHFFDHKKLNQRFAFLLKPNDFCGKYLKDLTMNKWVTSKEAAMFIHHVGQLRTLTEYETREHFWANLFSHDAILHLEAMETKGLYAYAPYIVKPNFNISVDSRMINQIKNIQYLRLSTEIRLFPHGVAVAHIKAYLKAPLTVKEFTELENAFLKQRIFNLSSLGAEKLDLEVHKSYSMQELFAAISKRLWKTLYIGGIDVIDRSTPIERHRIVFINAPAGVTLSEADVAGIMWLSENPMGKQIENSKEQRVKGLAETDVLAFGQGATLLCAPENNPRTSKCLRMNYSNVVEFCLLQRFWLSMINERLMSERQQFLFGKSTNLRELDASAVEAIYLSFLEYDNCFRGGHRELFNLVTDITNCKSKRVKFQLAFDEVWLASQLVDLINEMQTKLQTIMNSAAMDSFANLHSALATQVFNQGVAIKGGIMGAVNTLVAAEAAPFPNTANIYNLRVALQTNIAAFPSYLNSYQTLVDSLLQDKKQIENVADQKRQAGKQAPEKKEVEGLLQSATTMLDDANNLKKDLDTTQPARTFWEKAKPYVGFLVGATTAVLKAAGIIPS